MKKSPYRNIWLFFASIYLLSALLYAPILISGKGINTPFNTTLMVLITFIPSIMGVLFTYLTKGSEERRDFWRRTLYWPHSRRSMVFIALLILPLTQIATFLFSNYISGLPLSMTYATEMLSNWKMVVQFLCVEFLLGAVSEELGWRGYALDELQSHWSALKSSMVLGFLWAFWHTPAFLTPGLSQYSPEGLFTWKYAGFLAAVTIGNIIHTWAYNNIGRSILVAGILMHFVQNATMVFMGGIFDNFTVPPTYWLVWLVFTTIVSATLVLVYGKQTLTRQPFEHRSHRGISDSANQRISDVAR
jgi:membrane protease YdiL (CAAX protease family)